MDLSDFMSNFRDRLADPGLSPESNLDLSDFVSNFRDRLADPGLSPESNFDKIVIDFSSELEQLQFKNLLDSSLVDEKENSNDEIAVVYYTETSSLTLTVGYAAIESIENSNTMDAGYEISDGDEDDLLVFDAYLFTLIKQGKEYRCYSTPDSTSVYRVVNAENRTCYCKLVKTSN